MKTDLNVVEKPKKERIMKVKEMKKIHVRHVVRWEMERRLIYNDWTPRKNSFNIATGNYEEGVREKSLGDDCIYIVHSRRN